MTGQNENSSVIKSLLLASLKSTLTTLEIVREECRNTSSSLQCGHVVEVKEILKQINGSVSEIRTQIVDDATNDSFHHEVDNEGSQRDCSLAVENGGDNSSSGCIPLNERDNPESRRNSRRGSIGRINLAHFKTNETRSKDVSTVLLKNKYNPLDGEGSTNLDDSEESCSSLQILEKREHSLGSLMGLRTDSLRPSPAKRRGALSIMPKPSRFHSRSRTPATRGGSIHPISTRSTQEGTMIGSKALAERKLSTKESWVQMASEAFKLIDVNGDGFLQKEEVLNAIKEMQKNAGIEHKINSLAMAEAMICEVDKDGDGQIDILEFIEMMKRDNEITSKVSKQNHRMSQLARDVLMAHQKKIESSVIGNDLWMMNPQKSFHACWDIVVSVLILITVMTMPLSLGWEILNERFFVMNLLFDMIFLLDVCKNFCTGIVDENDALIMDFRIVRNNYLTGFFITDFCSSIPLDLIFKAIGISSDSGTVAGTKHSLKMIKLLKVTKMFKLFRISQLFQHIREMSMWLEETMHIHISDGFTKLLRLGVGALILGHWIGCFNFLLVRLHDFPEDSWVVYAGLEDATPHTQWTWSFFKALAQMIMIGFETPPFTNASCDTLSHWCGIEHWVTLFCLYVGAVFYSLLISSISSIIQKANLASGDFEENLLQIDDYMRSKKLPAAMREKVKEYFHIEHADGKLFDEEKILGLVTPPLRKEIMGFNARGVINKVPFLSSITNKPFAKELATVIEPVVAFADELLIRAKTTGHEMYFIHNGVVEIFVPGANSAYLAIGDGCYFGEVSLLLGVKRTASARTKTQCMLYRVKRSKLLSCLKDFPESMRQMEKVAKSRQKRLAYYMDPEDNELLPQDEIDAEDAKTELFGADADEVAFVKEEAFERTNKYRKTGRHTRSEPRRQSFLGTTGSAQLSAMQQLDVRKSIDITSQSIS